jgi:hypothetical protein
MKELEVLKELIHMSKEDENLAQAIVTAMQVVDNQNKGEK